MHMCLYKARLVSDTLKKPLFLKDKLDFFFVCKLTTLYVYIYMSEEHLQRTTQNAHLLRTEGTICTYPLSNIQE